MGPAAPWSDLRRAARRPPPGPAPAARRPPPAADRTCAARRSPLAARTCARRPPPGPAPAALRPDLRRPSATRAHAILLFMKPWSSRGRGGGGR
jgi:hypothetical protein